MKRIKGQKQDQKISKAVTSYLAKRQLEKETAKRDKEQTFANREANKLIKLEKDQFTQDKLRETENKLKRAS